MRTCSKRCSHGEEVKGVIRQMDKEEKLQIDNDSGQQGHVFRPV